MVFLVEGRDVFGVRDRPLFDAMLARLDPPIGFESWEAWFAHDAAHPAPRDSRTDAEVVADIRRVHGRTPLHEAIADGALARATELIDSGADIDAQRAVYLRVIQQTTPALRAIVERFLK